MIISLGSELPQTSSDLPEDLGRASRSPHSEETAVVFLFGLASSDAYRAGDVAIPAVGSYPAVSPLPDPLRLDWDPVALAIGGLFSVVPVSDYSAWVLPSTLPVKSGLSSRLATSNHPYSSSAQVSIRTDNHRCNISQGRRSDRRTFAAIPESRSCGDVAKPPFEIDPLYRLCYSGAPPLYLQPEFLD